MRAAERSRRVLLRAAVVACLSVMLASRSVAADAHRLALQISDDDPAKMRAVLDVAANVSRFYSGRGDDVEIVVVAFNGGIEMLLADRSPVKDRLANFAKSMPNVTFRVCGNSLETLAAKEGRQPVLMPGVEVVEAGVAELVDLAEKHWTIVRP